MEITKTKPDDYIESLDPSVKEDIRTLDKMISKIAKNKERVMWEGKFWGGSEQRIIGYGSYKYVGSNKKEGVWFIVGLAMQKNYITVFANGVVERTYIAELHKDRLGKAKVGKSSISFKTIKDINLEVLEEVIQLAFKNS